MRNEPKKKDIKAWVSALRSGKYPQGTGELQSKEGFCCLGVAVMEFVPKPNVNFYKDTSRLCGSFPDGFAQPNSPYWLQAINDDFENKTGCSLSFLNDGGFRDGLNFPPHTFDEIADLLEAVYIHEVLS